MRRKFFSGQGAGDSGLGYFVERTDMFPEPTDATSVMVRAIRAQIDSLFANGAKYRKSGKDEN